MKAIPTEDKKKQIMYNIEAEKTCIQFYVQTRLQNIQVIILYAQSA